jgi:hypothetical protein
MGNLLELRGFSAPDAIAAGAVDEKNADAKWRELKTGATLTSFC